MVEFFHDLFFLMTPLTQTHSKVCPLITPYIRSLATNVNSLVLCCHIYTNFTEPSIHNVSQVTEENIGIVNTFDVRLHSDMNHKSLGDANARGHEL